jgi:hypothetical protein
MSAKAYSQPASFTICSPELVEGHHSPLTLVKGNHEYQEQLQQLTVLSWQIAYTALWNGEQFSATEKERAQELIRDFIKQQPNPRKAYTELAQRVLLARQYILTHPGTYAPLPSQWFSPANKNGFSGTHRWYAALEETRIARPLYKQVIKAFPEAILEITQSANARDFHYWRNYFAEQNAQATLNLFLATIANCQF